MTQQGDVREVVMIDSEVDLMMSDMQEQRRRFCRTWDAISEQLGVPVAPAELDTLAYGLAYSFATAVIEGVCVSHDVFGAAGPFFDLREEHVPPTAVDDLKDSVRYLEARGLLAHDPEQPHLAQVLEESEVTR